MGFCHSLVHTSGSRADGEQEDFWTRCTLGLGRAGGSWKITHEHNSAPTHMDRSGRSAFDLRP